MRISREAISTRHVGVLLRLFAVAEEAVGVAEPLDRAVAEILFGGFGEDSLFKVNNFVKGFRFFAMTAAIIINRESKPSHHLEIVGKFTVKLTSDGDRLCGFSLFQKLSRLFGMAVDFLLLADFPHAQKVVDGHVKE